VHAFGIESFLVGQFEQPRQDVAADLGRTGMAGNPETVTATRNFDIEAALYLPRGALSAAGVHQTDRKDWQGGCCRRARERCLEKSVQHSKCVSGTSV
jgi:hypothetical protein